MDPEAFWRQTPRTFAAIMEGRIEAAKSAYNERMSLAWHVAVLSMSEPKRFPRLKDLLVDRDPAPREPQGPAEMLGVMQSWVAATKRRG